MSGDDVYEIEEAAAMAGATASAIRMWQLRYGWPHPWRHPRNGYRLFTRPQIEEIARVVALLRQGCHIGTIIVDGMPRFPSTKTKAVEWVRYALLPEPVNPEARTFRVELERAMRSRDSARSAEWLHRAPIVLRPGDRLVAAWLPGYFGAREWQRLGRPLARDLGQIIFRLAGADVLAGCVGRWATAEALS